MNRAFYYRESKGLFVVGALAIWLAFLGLFGPSLPANSSVLKNKASLEKSTNEVTGRWSKQKGLWRFQKAGEFNAPDIAEKAKPAVAPLTTQSLQSLQSLQSSRYHRARMRAARARLANEIGRWSNIGERMKMQQKRGKTAPGKTALNVQPKKPELSAKPRQRWMQRDGVWVYESDFEWTTKPFI